MTGAVSLPPLLTLATAWLLVCALTFWRWRRGTLKQPYHLDLLAVGGLAAANVPLFWQVLFDGASMPEGGGDLASFLYPMYGFASQAIKSGQLPLWNPYLFSGMPFQADIQSGLFYPLNLIFERAARPFDYLTMEWLAMLHYALAGAFAYLLARSIGASRLGSLCGGLVWMWSGFMVAQLGHMNMIEVAVWLPLQLLLLGLAVRGVRPLLTVPATSAVLAIAFFAGHTQLFLYELLAMVLFVLIRGEYRRGLPVLAIAVAGAALLAAVQILPSLELTRLSLRAGISYDESTKFALAPAGLLTLLIPHFFGENAQNYWGSWTTTEVFGYAGILPLLLAAAALRLRRSGETRFWVLLAVLGLLLSLGSATVLQGWLYRFVPGFDKVRAPGRFLVYFDLGVAMLAALGFDAVREPRARARLVLARIRQADLAAFALTLVAAVAGYGVLLTHQHEDAVIFHRMEVAESGIVVLALLLVASYFLLRARRRWTPGYAALAIGLIALDLGSSGYSFNPGYHDPSVPFRQTAALDSLRATAGTRVDTATNVDDVFPPDLPMLARVDSVWGLFNPVQLSDYYDYWKTYVSGRGSALYDLLGARYLLAKKDTPLDAKFQPRATFDEFNLYENPASLPRAFGVARVAGGSHDQALQTVRTSGFDPAHQAILEGGPALDGSGGPWPATVTSETDNRLAFDVDLPAPAGVVATVPYYPGWIWQVNGSDSAPLRADFVFQGVTLPAGRHHLELRFDPPIFRLGALLSIAGWLLAAAVFVFGMLPAGRYRFAGGV